MWRPKWVLSCPFGHASQSATAPTVTVLAEGNGPALVALGLGAVACPPGVLAAYLRTPEPLLSRWEHDACPIPARH